MIEEATKFATKEADTFKDSLQYLVEQQNEQKVIDQQSATQRYQNLLTEIENQRAPIQDQYAKDTKQAFVNKILANRATGDTLNRLGLNTQGFGVNQLAQNETAYGANIAKLKTDRNVANRAIDEQVVEAGGDYALANLDIDADYAGRLLDLNKYIGESRENKYDIAYGNFVDDAKYTDQLEQIALENAFKEKQLAETIRSNKASESAKWASINAQKEANALFSDGGFGNGDTQTNNSNEMVTTNYSPAFLSSRNAHSFLNDSISKQVIANGGISVGDLESKLSQGLSSGTLTSDDVDKILKSFGL